MPYGSDPCQFGDLWLPEGSGPHSLLIFIHGGFWRAKYGLEHAGFLCQAFASAGMAVWNVEYRRLGNPGGGWPETFLDVNRAIDRLRSLTSEYPLDLDRVVLMGHSAGGHLALWYAASRRIPVENLLHVADPLPLRAVVALAGVSDLVRAWELGLGDGVVAELLDGTPEQYPARYAVVSPRELLPVDVRQVLIHGTGDVIVPPEQSTQYHAIATTQGSDVTLVLLPGMGHFEPIDPGSKAWSYVFDAVAQALPV
jgi:acetyl esterase/lipase